MAIPSPGWAADSDEPIVIRIEGSHPKTKDELVVETTEAVTSEQLDRAAERAKEAVAKTASRNGKTFVLAVDGSNSTQAVDPSVALLAEQIGNSNPKGSEILVAKANSSETTTPHLRQQIIRKQLRVVLTIIRVVGIAGGVATAVYLTKGVPFITALPTIGVLAAAMSGALQWVNGGFQRWLISRGLFRISPAGEAPAPHYVTFGKLVLVSFAYLGIFRTGLYAFGFEHTPDYFSWENLREVATSAGLAATLEYAWDRLISERLADKTKRDPENYYRHLKEADVQAASISVIATIAETLSAGVAGWGVNKITAGVLAASGVATYVWSCKAPTRLQNAVKAFFSGAAGATCRVVRFLLGKE